jgi:hypothetical protein
LWFWCADFVIVMDLVGVLQKYHRTLNDILCGHARIRVTIVTIMEVLLHSRMKLMFCKNIVEHCVSFFESIGLQGHHAWWISSVTLWDKTNVMKNCYKSIRDFVGLWDLIQCVALQWTSRLFISICETLERHI